MSLETALARIAELNSLVSGTPPPAAQPQTASGVFAGELDRAMNGGATAASLSPAGGLTGPIGRGPAAIVAAARGEVGVSEQPPGSNNSRRITKYREALSGPTPPPGPWCAYFVSWAAKQAGMSLGPGFGSVDALYAWAKKNGKAVSAGNYTPRPGDLIVWDEHIGIVEKVQGGKIHTIEGNSSNKVSKRTYGSNGGGAIGYVRMGG